MAIRGQLGDLTRYMAWADAVVWKAVRASDEAARDGRIGDTLHHLHLVQHLFVQGWTGMSFTARERTEFPTLADLAAWGRDVHQTIASFLSGASDEALNREFRVPWAAQFEQRTGRPAGVHTVGESLWQVVLHSQHHRGQICARLRDVGAEPPTIDLIVWLWAGRPPADWA